MYGGMLLPGTFAGEGVAPREDVRKTCHASLAMGSPRSTARDQTPFLANAMPIAALLLALAPISDTHLVDFEGPNGYGSIQAAVDAASSGDTIIVRDPSVGLPQPIRDAFQIDGKGLTIYGLDRSSSPSPILVRASAITHLPPGETVTLQNFFFRGGPSSNPHRGLTVHDCEGAVRIESCTLLSTPHAGAEWSAALDVESALDVSLVDSVIRGTSVEAIHASRSRLTIYQCTIDGGQGPYATSYTHAVAGDGCDGIVLVNRSYIWIGRSTVRGGLGGWTECTHSSHCITESGDGGDGLVVEAGSLAVALESSVVGGLPGDSPGPAAGSTTGAHGADVIGNLVEVPGTHRDLVAPPYVDSGQTVPVAIEGLPGERVSLLIGTGGGHRFLGPLQGVLLVNSGFLGAPLDLGVIPASGLLEADVTLPPVLLETSTTYTLQASCSTSPTRFRLSPPARVTVLGANTPFLFTPDTLYLNASAAPGGRGRSWEHAARNLADLLASLPVHGAAAIEVRFARGTYTATPSGSPLDTSPLEITRSITLVGGFIGSGSTPNERGPTSHSTLSADLLGDDRLPGGTRNDNGNGILRISGDSTPTSIRLDGMRFVGSEDATAVSITAVTVEVERCEFSGNRSTYTVAGLSLNNFGDHHAVIRSSRFLNNHGGLGGAFRSSGFLHDDLQVRLEFLNCDFVGNQGSEWTFHYGISERVMVGGAILNTEDVVTRVVNCSFLDNESPIANGGDVIAFGGLFATDGNFGEGQFEVRNCAFLNEWSELGTAPMYSSLTPTEGHIVEHSVSAWADAGWGPTNIVAAPGFVDPLGADGLRASGDEDPRLRSDSVCLDAGDDVALPATITLDVLGVPRRVDLASVLGSSSIDIGAHERQQP